MKISQKLPYIVKKVFMLTSGGFSRSLGKLIFRKTAMETVFSFAFTGQLAYVKVT